MRLPILSALALIAAPVAAQQQRAPFVIAETGQGFAHLDDAVNAVRDGTATILIAPGTYRECTVQTGGRITFKAVQPGTAIFENQTCEEKAAFELRGRGSAVDGIVFRGFAVPDGNGAGIRIEMGDLTVTNSRFERGTGGHYVKLRARRVTITGNSFDDSRGNKTNYMIDLSEGGTGLIAGNTFVQGPRKENSSALIVVAAEGRTYPSTGLRIEGNTATLAPGAPGNPAFVADFTGQLGTLGQNDLGPGIRIFERRR